MFVVPEVSLGIFKKRMNRSQWSWDCNICWRLKPICATRLLSHIYSLYDSLKISKKNAILERYYERRWSCYHGTRYHPSVIVLLCISKWISKLFRNNSRDVTLLGPATHCYRKVPNATLKAVDRDDLLMQWLQWIESNLKALFLNFIIFISHFLGNFCQQKSHPKATSDTVECVNRWNVLTY